MNSSASVATSTVTVPATLRSAIRKIGILAFATAERPQQLGRLLVGGAVVAAQEPVEQHRVEGRVGGDVGDAVLEGERLDHRDAARAQLLGERADGAAAGSRRRGGEAVVDQEDSACQGSGRAFDHGRSPRGVRKGIDQ